MPYTQSIFKKTNWLNRKGFTLIEVLIGIFVFSVVSMAIYEGYIRVIDLVSVSRYKSTAVLLANEQFEILRNLPYSQVGEENGIPAGVFPHVQTFVRDGATFIATTTIRNIDDPFDGTIDGSPDDTSPADNKLAEIKITCSTCENFQPIILTARIAPKNLETSSTNGALFVKVFDASGQPVSGASVHIENNSLIPAKIIDDTTGASGILQVIDAPPGTEAYEITVSKSGYSTDKTYQRGGTTPDPIKPHATVVLQDVTQTSFAIDKVSTMNVSAMTDACVAVPSVTFNVNGAKLISNPSTPKYNQTFTTSGGYKTISGLEWDTYNINLADAAYVLQGIIPLLPLGLSPDSIQDLKLIVAPVTSGDSLMVSIKDNNSGLPITSADVSITLNGNTVSKVTGQGYLRQMDWSGGSGQIDFVIPNQYYSSDGFVDVSVPGQMTLKKTGSVYSNDGMLTSSVFNTGTSSNFYQFSIQSETQPVGTNVGVQIATSDTDTESTSWIFLGPDGTADTYYTSTSTNIWSGNNGRKYIRYKIFLHTDDTSVTPTISDIAFTYSSDCVPPGQVFFSGLSSDTYSMTVSKDGYLPNTSNVTLGGSWTSSIVNLSQ